jgi:hypothetical protein
MQSMAKAAVQAAGDRAALTIICTAVRLANEIVFSLNSFGLSIVMADQAPAWLDVWKHWLEFHNALLASSHSDSESVECVLGPHLSCTTPCSFVAMS